MTVESKCPFSGGTQARAAGPGTTNKGLVAKSAESENASPKLC